MNISIKWMNRKAMLIRGTRMLKAHWSNRLDSASLRIWFRRNLPRYAATVISQQPSNIERLERRFWQDVAKALASK